MNGSSEYNDLSSLACLLTGLELCITKDKMLLS